MSNDQYEYYTLLGLDKNATDAQIKKTYKKLAMKYHPDKQAGKTDAEIKKAEDMFKKISEAYQILSNPEQRKIYDRFGKDGMKGNPSASSQPFSNHDAFNVFENFFSNSGGFSSFGPGSFRFKSSKTTTNDDFYDFDDLSTFGDQPMNFHSIHRKQTQQQKKGADRSLQYGINLADFYNGRSLKLKIDYSIGSDRQSDVIDINIQKGWRPGVKLTFYNKSSCQTGEIPGDLIVELVEKPLDSDKIDSYFMRRIKSSPHLYSNSSKPDSIKYADLIYVLPILLNEAQKGGTKKIQHMDGRTITIQFDPLQRSIQEVVIPNEGMPIRSKGNIVGNGDLFVRFNIIL